MMPLYPDLNKQDQEVAFSRKMAKSYPSQICFGNILEISLNTILNFYHILVTNTEINARFRSLCLFYYM